MFRSVCAALVLFAATGGAAWAQSAPPLGVPERAAQAELFSSVTNGYPSFGTAESKAFLALAPAGRVTAVEAGFAWAKGYVGSAAFKDAYAQQRAGAEPAAPEMKGSVDDELKQRLDKMADDLKDARSKLTALPAEARAEVAKAFDQQEASFKDPQMIDIMRQGVVASRTQAQAEYDKNHAQWTKDWPADPGALIARRLKEFLEVCGDVNFDAKLVEEEDRFTFADPDLQSKPSNWKLCYRAGREATVAARAQAQTWFAALPAAP
jgi:hypothetical protein